MEAREDVACYDTVQVVGLVVKSEGDLVSVKVKRKEMCGQCPAAGVCSSFGGKDFSVEALNKCGAHVGDKVKLELRTSMFLKASFIVYAIPLLSFFVFSFAAYAICQRTGFPNKDVLTAFFGVIGVLVGYIFVGLYHRRHKGQRRFYPYAVGIVE